MLITNNNVALMGGSLMVIVVIALMIYGGHISGASANALAGFLGIVSVFGVFVSAYSMSGLWVDKPQPLGENDPARLNAA